MSYTRYYHIGVEIELIAEPYEVHHPLKRMVYYEALATSLRCYDLDAVADDLKGRYRKHEEHYDKWFITKDGSLGDPSHPAIPLEAVSPILRTDESWESEIDTFWQAWHEIFYTPRRSKLCGSHIHISPGPDKRFSLDNLHSVASGIVYYAKNLEDILPSSRRGNRYCRSNWTAPSNVCYWYEDGTDDDTDLTITEIYKTCSAMELMEFMQNDRRVLWNFAHVVPGSTGTIEFRGGRGLRGPVRTKWWIAFVTAFVHMCSLQYFPEFEASERPTTDEFWADIKIAAKQVQVNGELPKRWRHLNESVRAGNREDPNDTSDSDDSVTSSIISKGASLYSDSECATSEEEEMMASLRRRRRKKCVIL